MLSDLATIDAMVSADGVVSEAAGALRGFYRPHGGFPAWTPADEIAGTAIKVAICVFRVSCSAQYSGFSSASPFAPLDTARKLLITPRAETGVRTESR